MVRGRHLGFITKISLFKIRLRLTIRRGKRHLSLIVRWQGGRLVTERPLTKKYHSSLNFMKDGGDVYFFWLFWSVQRSEVWTLTQGGAWDLFPHQHLKDAVQYFGYHYAWFFSMTGVHLAKEDTLDSQQPLVSSPWIAPEGSEGRHEWSEDSKKVTVELSMEGWGREGEESTSVAFNGLSFLCSQSMSDTPTL